MRLGLHWRVSFVYVVFTMTDNELFTNLQTNKDLLRRRHDDTSLVAPSAPPSSPSPDLDARHRLRSASSPSLVVRRTRLSTYGDRAFPVAASQVWNSLPHHVTSAQSLPVFCTRLKTYLFSRSFPWQYYCLYLRSDTCHFGHINRFYLLTYLPTTMSAWYWPTPPMGIPTSPVSMTTRDKLQSINVKFWNEQTDQHLMMTWRSWSTCRIASCKLKENYCVLKRRNYRLCKAFRLIWLQYVCSAELVVLSKV